MTDYRQKALDFLEACNAKMEINFIGVETNQNWNDNQRRNKYHFTITTPKGKMQGDFWDSVTNTEITLMTPDDFSIKMYRAHLDALMNHEKVRVRNTLKAIKETAKPTEYEILSCLEKYEVGTMDDFFHEFGFEVKNADDIFCFLNTYNAVVKEYRDLCRIFTEEQMEMLREIE